MDNYVINGTERYGVQGNSPRWIEIATATWLCILLLFSVFFNGGILVIFVRFRLISVFYNILLTALLVNNLSLATFAIPFPIVAELSRGWLVNLKFESCVFYAFVVYFLGITSMFLHAAISLTRYYVVVRCQAGIRTISVYVTWWLVVSCYCMSLVLAIGPIFGFGSYGLEEHGTSCGLAWNDTRLVNKIYLLIILVLTFGIPILVMMFCYGAIYRTMTKSSVAPESATSNRNNVQQRHERHIHKVSLCMVGMFILSWTPYTIVSFYQAFAPGHKLGPIVTRVPAVVAKTGVLWDPIIYALTTSDIREQARVLCRLGRANWTPLSNRI